MIFGLTSHIESGIASIVSFIASFFIEFVSFKYLIYQRENNALLYLWKYGLLMMNISLMIYSGYKGIKYDSGFIMTFSIILLVAAILSGYAYYNVRIRTLSRRLPSTNINI